MQKFCQNLLQNHLNFPGSVLRIRRNISQLRFLSCFEVLWKNSYVFVFFRRTQNFSDIVENSSHPLRKCFQKVKGVAHAKFQDLIKRRRSRNSERRYNKWGVITYLIIVNDKNFQNFGKKAINDSKHSMYSHYAS